MKIDKLIKILLKKKGDENNSIDLDAYARGLIDMHDHMRKSKKVFMCNVLSENDFTKGIDAFVTYNTVKVLRSKKDAFMKALVDYFVNNDIFSWGFTQTPFKTHYRIKRVDQL